MPGEFNQTDDRVTTTVGKCWMKKRDSTFI